MLRRLFRRHPAFVGAIDHPVTISGTGFEAFDALPGDVVVRPSQAEPPQSFWCLYHQRRESSYLLDCCWSCGVNACAESMAGHSEVCLGKGRALERAGQERLWHYIHQWAQADRDADGAPSLRAMAAVTAVEEAARLLRVVAPLEGLEVYKRSHARLWWAASLAFYVLSAASLGALLNTALRAWGWIS